MLGHCCAIWMVFKAYRPAMWPKKILNNNTLLLRVLFGQIWGHLEAKLGLSWSMFGSLGAMLGHVEPMLNLFWALVGPN